MLLAAGVGVGLSAAPGYSFGVFIGPWQHEFGWNITEISLAISIMSVVVALGSPFVGWMLDRWGARRMSLFGTTLMCAIFAAMATLGGSVYIYWLVWAALGVGVLLASTPVWLIAVANRFSAKRGLALSLALCGSNLTGAITPILAALLIERFDWRVASMGVGLILFVTSFPLTIFFFYDARDLRRLDDTDERRKADITARLATGMTHREALRTRNFWLLMISFVLAGCGINGFLVHLVPMLTDRGLSPMLAASAISVLSIAAIAGRLVAGFLMDRVFAPRLASAALMIPIAACIILLALPPSYVGAIAAGTFVGLSIGSEFNMIAFLTARYFGMRSYGIIHGLTYGAFITGCIFGPLLVGVLYSVSGNYRVSIEVLGGFFFVAAITMLFCADYPTWENENPTTEQLADGSFATN